MTESTMSGGGTISPGGTPAGPRIADSQLIEGSGEPMQQTEETITNPDDKIVDEGNSSDISRG